MASVNFNGKIYDQHAALVAAGNRGLRYGDGLFETIKLRKGKLCLFGSHMERLFAGLALLGFEVPKLFTRELLESGILSLAKKNGHHNARVRVNVFRGQGGLYDAENHRPNYLIETFDLPETQGELNENGLTLCIYRDAVKPIDLFSNFKHNSFLPYTMGALFAAQNRCNDAIVLNSAGRVADSTIANVFAIKNKQVFTPALSEGCIAGVMRKHIIECLAGTVYAVTETAMTEQLLIEADEIFLCNSIRNIRWVGALANHTYRNNDVKLLHKLITEREPGLLS